MKDTTKTIAAVAAAGVLIAGGIALKPSDVKVKDVKDFKWSANQAHEIPQLMETWPENKQHLKNGEFAFSYQEEGSMNLFAKDELGNEWIVARFDCGPIVDGTSLDGEI